MGFLLDPKKWEDFEAKDVNRKERRQNKKLIMKF